MRFAVSMLTILGIASIIGTVLKQNEPYENYIIKFGQFWFEMFEKLGLFDVYHALWFLLILLFLVISTSFCIYRNSPLMIKEWKTFKEHATEKSLRAFGHQASLKHHAELAVTQAKLLNYLTGQGFKYKAGEQKNGDVLIAAKAGTHQRLGYILTHTAIVVICFGGIRDGNLPFKIQEMLGKKKIEVLDIPASQVPEISRLSTANASYRANMTLPEGASSDVAFVRVRDGYLVQQLPFRVALKDFRIEHYATGQPKSFESDIVIADPDLKQPLEKTISVNHPLIYKGIAIYQSDFQDGGSSLKFKGWDLSSINQPSFEVNGVVGSKGTLGQDNAKLTVEFNEFRKFNIINLSPDGKGKPHNVGPNTTFKLRDNTGQAREYVNYMQPLNIDGKAYFVSGMRETVQEDFKYLRIPADDDLSIDGFINLRSVLMNSVQQAEIARRLVEKSSMQDAQMKVQFEESIQKILSAFAQGGYTRLSQAIEKAVPVAERQKAADAYFKLLNTAALEAYNMSLAARHKSEVTLNPEVLAFLQDSLNAMNDLFFYGTPYYFQLDDYVLKEASGLQLTKSPGQKWVYLGSVLLVLGIFAMFYIRERRIWLLIKADNEVLLTMSSNRKNLDFEQEFERIRNQLGQLLS
ncbi:MAG TPA: cytochrome C biogenesis protein [Methylophilaceae bacterium]|nr:cytochrome C biogenesis protein [Methylophilaceae bacterium]